MAFWELPLLRLLVCVAAVAIEWDYDDNSVGYGKRARDGRFPIDLQCDEGKKRRNCAAPRFPMRVSVSFHDTHTRTCVCRLDLDFELAHRKSIETTIGRRRLAL